MVTAGGNGERTRRRSGGAVPVVGQRFCRASEERQLTVQKTSVFYTGDGFAVYEHHHRRHDGNPPQEVYREGEETGELVFRVDSYGPDPHHHAMGKRGAARDELILMGPAGECILTVRRKWPSLHQRWEGFLGERVERQKPLFSIRRDSIIGRSAGIGVEVYGDQPSGGHLQYRVEGSFPQRCCAVYEVRSSGGVEGIVGEEEEEEDEGESGGFEAVAEIRRKVVPASSSSGRIASDGSVVVLGKDVFCLRLAPGFDAAFAMGLVLVLDRMTGDDGGDGRDEVLPSGQPPSPAGDGEECCHSGSF